jgi:hypothetical protein
MIPKPKGGHASGLNGRDNLAGYQASDNLRTFRGLDPTRCTVWETASDFAGAQP